MVVKIGRKETGHWLSGNPRTQVCYDPHSATGGLCLPAPSREASQRLGYRCYGSMGWLSLMGGFGMEAPDRGRKAIFGSHSPAFVLGSLGRSALARRLTGGVRPNARQRMSDRKAAYHLVTPNAEGTAAK